MKIVLEKVSPEKLAKYLENPTLRVFGITPISEGYRPGQEEKTQTLYNVEILVLGELRDRLLGLLEVASGS